MPTALFFPSYLGSGFGHVSRCLALANELKTHGWCTPFALAGVHDGDPAQVASLIQNLVA